MALATICLVTLGLLAGTHAAFAARSTSDGAAPEFGFVETSTDAVLGGSYGAPDNGPEPAFLVTDMEVEEKGEGSSDPRASRARSALGTARPRRVVLTRERILAAEGVPPTRPRSQHGARGPPGV